MSHIRSDGPDGAPPTNKTLLVVAGILLAAPVVALLWVSSYARETPRLGGVPFFFWYQFIWVFLCAGMTYAAHRLVLAARKPRPGSDGPGSDRPGSDRPGSDRPGSDRPGSDGAKNEEGDR